MDVDQSTPTPQAYTILRIKRKRNEEPLDALVVESRIRRKKSKARGGLDVFQYAQTVEDDVWNDKQSQKEIQEQITRIARESPLKTEPKSTTPSAPADLPLLASRQKEEASRRYTIIEHDDTEASARKFPKMPPKVVSAKELQHQQQQQQNTPEIKMYDAIPQDSISSRHPKSSPTSESMSEIDKFLPMLQDYLKIHDITPSPTLERSSHDTETDHNASDDDYVWDVFYHRPVTLSEWNEAANVATLTGLPPTFGDIYDSASDSEPEDEADEDSNAEEYYKNDYPDEDDSDEFHEDSDYDDIMHNKDDSDGDLW